MLRLIFLVILLSPTATIADVRNDLQLGGQIPFWIINGEAGTPSNTPEADITRANIQPRANEMFDIVIPSTMTWGWVEGRRGTLDFHRFDWANDWAQANRKQRLIQHLFWAWEDSKPDWFNRLNRPEMRTAVFTHIQDIRTEIGDVPRMTVINEMMDRHFLTNKLGTSIIAEIFQETRAKFPNTKLFLNEHANPNNHRGQNQIVDTLASYAEFVRDLDAQGVPFDHAGFQSYFTMEDVENLGGINTFVAEYNRGVNLFSHLTGRKLYITELGFAASDPEYHARFLRVFFEMVKANRNIEGLIIFHWLDDQDQGTALVNRDGTLTPAGVVYYDVFDR